MVRIPHHPSNLTRAPAGKQRDPCPPHHSAGRTSVQKQCWTLRQIFDVSHLRLPVFCTVPIPSSVVRAAVVSRHGCYGLGSSLDSTTSFVHPPCFFNLGYLIRPAARLSTVSVKARRRIYARSTPTYFLSSPLCIPYYYLLLPSMPAGPMHGSTIKGLGFPLGSAHSALPLSLLSRGLEI